MNRSVQKCKKLDLYIEIFWILSHKFLKFYEVLRYETKYLEVYWFTRKKMNGSDDEFSIPQELKKKIKRKKERRKDVEGNKLVTKIMLGHGIILLLLANLRCVNVYCLFYMCTFKAGNNLIYTLFTFKGAQISMKSLYM